MAITTIGLSNDESMKIGNSWRLGGKGEGLRLSDGAKSMIVLYRWLKRSSEAPEKAAELPRPPKETYGTISVVL